MRPTSFRLSPANLRNVRALAHLLGTTQGEAVATATTWLLDETVKHTDLAFRCEALLRSKGLPIRIPDDDDDRLWLLGATDAELAKWFDT